VNPIATLAALLLLLVANGTPLLAKKLLGDRFARPLDFGARFVDGRPLLGPSKTVRGVVLAIAATAAAAGALGLGPGLGAAAGGAAMAGDVLSSFLKRRFGVATSGMTLGLDQVPEALLPLLVCRRPLSLSAADILLGIAVFGVGEILLSRLLYRFNLRDRPY
jgi:hypothetical protein